MSTQPIQIQPLSQPVDIGDEVASFSPAIEAEIDGHLAKYPVMRSAILPLMFIVQRERGYLDPPGVAYLAKRLALRITDIWEVATFYSMLHTEPVGKYHIQICKTLSCRIMGEPGITEHVCRRLGINPGETTADEKFTVSLVECLGSCGTAPMGNLLMRRSYYRLSYRPQELNGSVRENARRVNKRSHRRKFFS